MSIDWDAVEKETAKQYKDYAPEGKFTTKLESVEVKQAGTKGNYVAELTFAETDEYKFPKASYWLSKDKANWRIHSMKELLSVLSGSEENAKKVCEMAESKGSYDYAVQGYEKGLMALAKKGVKVEIEVFFNDRYSSKGTPMNDATLADPRVNNKGGKKKAETAADPMAGAEEVDLSQDSNFGEIPF